MIRNVASEVNQNVETCNKLARQLDEIKILLINPAEYITSLNLTTFLNLKSDADAILDFISDFKKPKSLFAIPGAYMSKVMHRKETNHTFMEFSANIARSMTLLTQMSQLQAANAAKETAAAAKQTADDTRQILIQVKGIHFDKHLMYLSDCFTIDVEKRLLRRHNGRFIVC
jgi:hypothetical protein